MVITGSQPGWNFRVNRVLLKETIRKTVVDCIENWARHAVPLHDYMACARLHRGVEAKHATSAPNLGHGANIVAAHYV